MTDALRRAARTALETGRKPPGTSTFLDREEANGLIVRAVNGQGGRMTPVTPSEVQILADLFERRHIVRNGAYQGPTTTQHAVPPGAVAMDHGAEERLWLFLHSHSVPTRELQPIVKARIEGVLQTIRMAPSSTPPSLKNSVPFVLHDDGAGAVRTAHILPTTRQFVIEDAAADGTRGWLGPLSFPGGVVAAARFEDVSRVPQFRAERGVRALTGASVDLAAATFRRHRGELTVSFQLPGASFRVTPATDVDGTDVLSRVVVREEKPLLDRRQASSLEAALRDSGIVGPAVAAVGTGANGRTAVVYAVPGGRVAQAVSVRTSSSGAQTVAPFAYDDGEARALVTTLVRAKALALAANIGPEGKLEVYARLQQLAPSTLTKVTDAADSPVGVDLRREVQFVVPDVLGDIAVFVTFDKTTGAVRIEDFN